MVFTREHEIFIITYRNQFSKWVRRKVIIPFCVNRIAYLPNNFETNNIGVNRTADNRRCVFCTVFYFFHNMHKPIFPIKIIYEYLCVYVSTSITRMFWYVKALCCCRQLNWRYFILITQTRRTDNLKTFHKWILWERFVLETQTEIEICVRSFEFVLRVGVGDSIENAPLM
jgi:hypothetical protein